MSAAQNDKISPVRFESGESRLLAGLRRHHRFDAAPLGIEKQWEDFLPLAESINERTNEHLYGVMCGADDSSLEYMCGVEVRSFEKIDGGWGRIRVPPQEYAIFRHDGPLSTIHLTWGKILHWLDSGSYESAHAPDFELYGPDWNPLTGVGSVEIWVGVRARK